MQWFFATSKCRFFLAIAAASGLLFSNAFASTYLEVLQSLQPGKITQIAQTDGPDTVITTTGERYLLADVVAASVESDAERKATAEALSELLTGRYVQPYTTTATRDRYGRLPAQLVYLETPQSKGVWVQADLVARGLVAVMPRPDTAAEVHDALLQIESSAMAARVGRWENPTNAVLPADDPAAISPGFRIVEGRVFAIGESRNSVFINFGQDWREDFTIIVQRSDRKAFANEIRGLRTLEGQKVRVRGWVFERGGPSIRALHQHTIEILEGNE